MANEYQLLSLNIGLPKEVTYGGKVIHTGINKKQVKEPVFLSFVKFNGDGQADLVHHGGVDKAVCVYSGNIMDIGKRVESSTYIWSIWRKYNN